MVGGRAGFSQVNRGDDGKARDHPHGTGLAEPLTIHPSQRNRSAPNHRPGDSSCSPPRMSLAQRRQASASIVSRWRWKHSAQSS